MHSGLSMVTLRLPRLARDHSERAIEPQFVRRLAVRFLTAVPGTLPLGRLVSVDGFDDVLSSPDVIDAGLYLRPGEIIQPVEVDADRRGYVIAGGDDPKTPLAAAKAAIRSFRSSPSRQACRSRSRRSRGRSDTGFRTAKPKQLGAPPASRVRGWSRLAGVRRERFSRSTGPERAWFRVGVWRGFDFRGSASRVWPSCSSGLQARSVRRTG